MRTAPCGIFRHQQTLRHVRPQIHLRNHDLGPSCSGVAPQGASLRPRWRLEGPAASLDAASARGGAHVGHVGAHVGHVDAIRWGERSGNCLGR